jgi:hypothetical protein
VVPLLKCKGYTYTIGRLSVGIPASSKAVGRTSGSSPLQFLKRLFYISQASAEHYTLFLYYICTIITKRSKTTNSYK